MGCEAGVLILSIDLELGVEHQQSCHQRRLDEVQVKLLEITNKYKLPVTWAVADPALSAATDSIRSAPCGHEIAVLGDKAWLGTGCGRARLNRELSRRFAGARKSGIPVSTLALRTGEQALDLDLLVDHGVTALRGPGLQSLRESRDFGSPPTRFGIWQPPLASNIPQSTSWWSPAVWAIRREIRRATRQGTLLHLYIDAPRLAIERDASLKSIAAVLRYATAKRDSGSLTIQTIQQVAAALLANRTGNPSRSILRPAA